MKDHGEFQNPGERGTFSKGENGDKIVASHGFGLTLSGVIWSCFLFWGCVAALAYSIGSNAWIGILIFSSSLVIWCAAMILLMRIR